MEYFALSYSISTSTPRSEPKKTVLNVLAINVAHAIIMLPINRKEVLTGPNTRGQDKIAPWLDGIDNQPHRGQGTAHEIPSKRQYHLLTSCTCTEETACDVNSCEAQPKKAEDYGRNITHCLKRRSTHFTFLFHRILR